MNPPHWPCFPLYLLIIAVILSTTPYSLCANDTRFDDCRDHPFICGNIRSIKYPFWGLNRLDYCGQPGFEINCQDNIPLITMVSEKYRILEINPEVNALVVAREDYWDEICPARFFNTTIDPTVFTYASGLRNLTLFYGCPFLVAPNLGNLFQRNCTINNTDTNFLYVRRSVPIDPGVGKCNSTIVLPILERNAQALDDNTTTIGAAIDGGFELKWDVNIEQCSKCTESGGECGFNRTDSRFACFCHDQPYANVCLAKPGIFMSDFYRPLNYLQVSSSSLVF